MISTKFIMATTCEKGGRSGIRTNIWKMQVIVKVLVLALNSELVGFHHVLFCIHERDPIIFLIRAFLSKLNA